VFTLALCVTCSLLLTAAATGLRDRQQANMLADRQKNLLQSVGLVAPEEKWATSCRPTSYCTDIESRDNKLTGEHRRL
jgi:Na+-transporting NADH:ubiquinone oxidoreductase subunit C